jgi:RNA polymerase sigma-70 factor (ECF subfamily)
MARQVSQVRFVELLEEHKKILFKIANGYSRPGADQEDLVQEMVLQLWRSFDRYDPALRFSTWMYRICLNVAISYCRKETKRRRTLLLDLEAILQVAAEPSQATALAEDLAALQQLLEQLNELDRALILLHLDGNSYETISQILGISETNVGTKLNRIKQKLRSLGGQEKERQGQHGAGKS